MNAPVETQPALPSNAQTSALILDPQAMQNMVAFADFMCKAVITVPKHLQGNSGDCLAVTMQAMQWGMNPFAVAQKTHLVNATLCIPFIPNKNIFLTLLKVANTSINFNFIVWFKLV